MDWRTLLFIYLFIIALRYLYCVISVATKCPHPNLKFRWIRRVTHKDFNDAAALLELR